MSMTRRTLLVRSGAVLAWGAAGGGLVARQLGAFDPAPRFDQSAFPKPGTSSAAVLRASGYDGDLTGLLLDGLREVGVDICFCRWQNSRRLRHTFEFARQLRERFEVQKYFAVARAFHPLGSVAQRPPIGVFERQSLRLELPCRCREGSEWCGCWSG